MRIRIVRFDSCNYNIFFTVVTATCNRLDNPFSPGRGLSLFEVVVK